MTSPRSFLRQLPAVAVAAAAVLAGCSSSAPGPSATPTTVGTAAPGGSTTVAGPPTTLWAAGPDPCALLTESEMSKLSGFQMRSAASPSKLGTGQPVQACVFSHSVAGIRGGSASVTVLPPGTPFDLDAQNVLDSHPVDGLGARAYAGHYKAAPSQGTNTVVVDMGNGGFSFGVLIFQDTDEAQILDTARLIASRWPASASPATGAPTAP